MKVTLNGKELDTVTIAGILMVPLLFGIFLCALFQ